MDDYDCFSFQDVVQEYPTMKQRNLLDVLSKMVSKGMLIKLSKGLYHIVPQSADPEHYIPDWHLVAKYLMRGKKYYIGYYSAMQVHGLITQPSLKEIVVIRHRVNPPKKIIQGIEFQFITHVMTRFFGYKKTWINSYEKVMVSDLEKTIVDAVTKPHLCDGVIEVAKAIYETRNKIKLERLFDYLIQNESKAAIKRYLFLYDLIGLEWTAHHEGMLKLRNVGEGFPLLDTSASDEGRKNHRFGLKINVDTETIKNSLYT
ncbi:type IV toxin-antitoxin system AbiEi family antitoxin [Aureispira sp. CCB-QB1]|uniref:type IV toxin-antitoxin system AbiEi family antitoxin domain-containing protein n=1 Tax=Aureispira sp. CCB-QB1 TaxID=1313421 RepID=UPI0018CC6227|nr:type IV toxin-antitoxin system AbiEi family antitoxin [Aureispira sp. CCB-QB1]